MFRGIALALTAGFLASGLQLHAADDTVQQAREVIAQAVKAHGGEEVLTKNKAGTARGAGKMNLPGVGEVDFTQESAHMLPDKFKEVVGLTVAGKNIKVAVLIVGEKVSITVDDKEIKLDDKQLDELKETGYRLKVGRLAWLLTDKQIELSLIGEDKVEGKPAIGVRVSSKGRRDVSLFFDKETHLLVKHESRAIETGTGNEVNEERIIAEYQKNKDGVPVPKKLIVKHDGKKFLEVEMSEVTFLEKLDDAEFKK